MTHSRRLIILVPVVLGLALLTSLVARDSPPGATTRRIVAAEPASRAGVASCSAFACHGGNGPDGDHRSVYATWMARDPHSRAGSALMGALSADIEARLAGRPGREPLPAERDRRCLPCHASPAWSAAAPDALALRQEGIDCETCHGPAARWVGPHTEPGWKTLSVEEKSARGMTPTKDLAARAVLCAGCHVGGPGRDVNHDLIAAGHPRLSFELVSYHDALPKHWDAAREQSASPAFEARVWALGQVASTRAALDVLAARAHAGIWPEFAEYACSACHRALSGTLGSSGPVRPAARLGSPPWGTWYFTLAGLVPREAGERPTEATPLVRLQRLMDGPEPAPAEAEHLALQARAQLDRRLAAGFDADSARRLLSHVAGSAPGPAPMCWDRAAQLTLAVSALTHSLERQGRPATPAMRSALEDMIRAIEADDFAADRFQRAFERYHR